jgi:hypothetical protein
MKHIAEVKGLDELITESGLKHKKIIEGLGFNPSTWHRKRKNFNSFTLGEINQLVEVLNNGARIEKFTAMEIFCSLQKGLGNQPDIVFRLDDVRNKLSPVLNLVSMIEDDLSEASHPLILNEVAQVKKSIAYLSQV